MIFCFQSGFDSLYNCWRSLLVTTTEANLSKHWLWLPIILDNNLLYLAVKAITRRLMGKQKARVYTSLHIRHFFPLLDCVLAR